VHDLDTSKDDAGTAERFESKHRSSDALDRPVVLLNDVVEVLTLRNRYRRVMLDIITFDAGGVGAALVDRDGCGKRVVPDGTSEKPLCRSPIALGGEQEVDGVARFIDRAIQILPLAADLDACLVHPPTLADDGLAFPERPFQHRHQPEGPAMNRGVIDRHPALVHHLFEIAQAQRIGDVPVHADQHDLQREPQALYHALHRVLMTIDQFAPGSGNP
jgi:hypothetical protein